MVGSRRRNRTEAAAEDYFPVRVRLSVPEGGLRQQLNEMQGWLNMHAGRGNF